MGETVNAEPFARYYPSVGEYAAVLEAQGFRVTFATHFDRTTKLDEGELGLRNWLITFADNVIESLPEIKREQVISRVERDLKPTLELRSVFKGVLAQHLGASEKDLDTRVFPESRAVKPLDGLIRSA